MKKVFLALAIAVACYACGGSDSGEKKPVSNNDSNGNSSIGTETPATTPATAPAGTDTAASTTTAAAAPGKDGKALIEASDCRTCHKDDTKLIGPSYADVAKKYENNEKNVALLAEKVQKGGTGVWGEIPMSPHPNINKEDAEAMVKYILSMKK